MFKPSSEDFIAYEKDKITFLLKWCGLALDKVSTDEVVEVSSVEVSVRQVIESVVDIGNLASSIEFDLDNEGLSAKDLWNKQKDLNDVSECWH